MTLQVDRIYSLQVGQGNGKGILIENLHIEFTVKKGSNNKKKTNKATIDIYNLSNEHQNYMEAPFVECALSVGYDRLGSFRLFSGQVTMAGTRKNGTDTITELQVESFYTELNHKRVSKSTAPGTSVKGVIQSLVKDIDGINRAVFSGQNINKAFVDGYPMTGTPREILNDLASAFELEWQIDDGVLYIMDTGFSYMSDTSKAFVIGETSGLIERPYFDFVEKQRSKKDKVRKTRKGVKLKILLNPAIVAGSIVKIDYAEFTGFYKVEQLTHKGGYLSDDWTTDLVCGTMLTVVK